jgi:hypothetical protein
VAVNVNIMFPAKPTGAGRFETEEDMMTFFSPVAEYFGFGTSSDGSTDVSLGIPDGEDVEEWLARMCDLLRAVGAHPDTFMAVFPEGNRPGDGWRRVDLKGGDRWVTEPDPM